MAVTVRYFINAETDGEHMLVQFKQPHFTPRVGERVYLSEKDEDAYRVKDIVHCYGKDGHNDTIDVYLEVAEIPLMTNTSNCYDGYYTSTYTEGMV